MLGFVPRGGTELVEALVGALVAEVKGFGFGVNEDGLGGLMLSLLILVMGSSGSSILKSCCCKSCCPMAV